MSNARFLLDRFFFLDDLTGFEITLLLEVSIDKLKSYYMLLFLFRALGFWTRIKKFYNSTSLSLIISCSILKVVSHELEAWKLKIGGSTVDDSSGAVGVGCCSAAKLTTAA